MTASPRGFRGFPTRAGDVLALAAGAVLPFSFAPFGLFYLAPVAIAGFFLALAARVVVGARRRDGEVRHLRAALGRAHLRVAPEIADDDCLVHSSHGWTSCVFRTRATAISQASGPRGVGSSYAM